MRKNGAAMRRRLDDRWVRTTTERGEWWDVVLPSFGIRVGAKRKTWQIITRLRGHNNPTRVKLGTFPEMSLAAARREAGKRLSGETLAPIKFRQAVEEFLSHGRTGKGRPLSPNTIRQYTGNMRRYAKPLHNRYFAEIRRGDIAKLTREIAIASGAPTASLVRSMLSRIWSWGISVGYLDNNVVTGSPAFAVGKRSRVLTDGEIGMIWRATEEPTDFHLIVRLCLWLGVRRGEAGGLRWSELRDGVWTLPGSRTKNGKALILPLPRQAVAAIDAWPVVVDRDCLFGNRSSRGFGDWERAKAELEERSGARGWLIHDLRRTTETRLAALGISKEVRSRILNHDIGQLDKAYQHYDFMLEKRQALQTWADTIEQIVRGGK
jgi:integrase